jgi:hypothetical protein
LETVINLKSGNSLNGKKMKRIQGDFVLAIGKGLTHKMGNIANGLNVNFQAVSKLSLEQEQNEKFYGRMKENLSLFSQMIDFLRFALLNPIQRVDRQTWAAIREFSEYNITHSLLEDFYIHWESIESDFFRILVPIILYYEGQISPGISIEEKEGKLILSYPGWRQFPRLTEYFDNKSIPYEVKKNQIIIEEG